MIYDIYYLENTFDFFFGETENKFDYDDIHKPTL